MLSINISRAALLATVQRSLKAVRPNSEPMFRCFRLTGKVTDNSLLLQLEGSDGAMSIISSAVPTQTTAGTIFVPAQQLEAVLSRLTQPDVLLQQEDGGLLLTCGRAKATLPLADHADKWPPEIDAEDGSEFRCKAADLKQSLIKVLWAGDDSESANKMGHNVQVVVGDGKATLAVSDTANLSFTTLDVTGTPLQPFLLPLRFAKVLLNALPDDSGQECVLVKGQGRLTCSFGQALLWMPLSSDPHWNLPDVGRLLGPDPATYTLLKKDLVNALELVKAGAVRDDREMHECTVELSPESCRVSSGKSEAVIDCKSSGREQFAPYGTDNLLAGLKAAPGDILDLTPGAHPMVQVKCGDDPWTAYVSQRRG